MLNLGVRRNILFFGDIFTGGRGRRTRIFIDILINLDIVYTFHLFHPRVRKNRSHG